MMSSRLLFPALFFCFFGVKSAAQSFLFGADLSYVNEMEDCGVVYKENGQPADPYQIFADHNCGIVRLRLWHTPAWYDGLNSGQRYSDLADVRRSILRAKAANMQVLLDFHLSDTWADPSHQRVPAAWEGVVNNLPLLQDSVFNYISQTLLSLHADGLLPDMVQIGNETNKGILLSAAQDSGPWVLEWPRNAALFKRAIEAVRTVETQTGQDIKVALHVAGPADAGWLMQGFWSNGVTDFDVIGLSYYWAWHQPTDMDDA
ncbi:MAG: arabinogalactan endo-1,4-beta-galactosidase, partial [Saprospiraceae bacterium]|nr:arabinogalactan endo-1,4-beta-galactosidase [Saprospiraceae bacterium]